MAKKLLIGTSGWSYDHWRGVFYPKALPAAQRLKFFAKNFETVEINNSFYRLPSRENFEKWEKETPSSFVFAVKVSRFITHIKKLKEAQEPLENFLNNATGLKKKLGPLLFQFPPNFQKNEERLEEFLKILPEDYEAAFEFRHSSWFDKEIYDLLKKGGVSLVIADSPKFPCELVLTAPFTFLRFHGGKILYGSNYSLEELKIWVERIKKYLKEGLKVYVYFNNDTLGYAIKNAQTLKTLLGSDR